MQSSHAWDVFGNESPTELHHKDCDRTPDSHPTGDAKAVAVEHPEQYAEEGETFDTSCQCLDPLLGSERRDSVPENPREVEATVGIVDGRVAMSADGDTELYVDIPEHRPLSGGERHATLRLSGDDYRGSVELDADDVEWLQAALAAATGRDA